MEIVSLMSEATRISMLKPDDQRCLAALLVWRRVAPDGAAGRGLQATRDQIR